MFPSAGPSADAAIPGEVSVPAVAPASPAVSKASPETRLGDGDRDTIDLPDYVPGLSPAQVTAMAALLDGKSATHAAVMAGVKRVTVYRWQYFHPEFAAALNSFRRQQYAEFSTRFSAMQEKMLSPPAPARGRRGDQAGAHRPAPAAGRARGPHGPLLQA
jgi:hypothetical protein